MPRYRFTQQITVLGYLRKHQFTGTLYLVEILHGTLGVGKILKHLVLHGVNAVEGDCHGGFSRNDLLLG